MGRSRYKIVTSDAPHLLTCTVINWLPLFTRPDTVQIVLDSFKFLQKERALQLFGYVILENHLHWIAQAPDLPKEIASFKSFTAKMIVRYFDERNMTSMLDRLAFHKKAHKVDRDRQVWEEGYHPQLLQGGEMMRQKLDYMHLNPVKRGYVDEPTHWRYSSARNYAGQAGLIDVRTEWQ